MPSGEFSLRRMLESCRSVFLKVEAVLPECRHRRRSFALRDMENPLGVASCCQEILAEKLKKKNWCAKEGCFGK